jgi:hypothetical protein
MDTEQLETAITTTARMLRTYRTFKAAGDLNHANRTQCRIDGFMEGLSVATSWTLAGSIMSSATMRVDAEARRNS